MASKTWALVKELRFLQLTLYIIFFLFAFPLFGYEWLMRLFSSIFLLNALLVSLSASGKTVRLKWLLWSLFGASVLFTFFYLSPLAPSGQLIFLKLAVGCDMLVLLICLGAILSFIFASTHVTLDTIFAAIVSYLIIAVTFAEVYMLLNFFSPQSFNLPLAVTPTAFNNFHGAMIYYSLIIITTVGIGDIVPQTSVAQLLTAIEAMVGQFFVAILVAWLVGRFISQSSGRRSPPD